MEGGYIADLRRGNDQKYEVGYIYIYIYIYIHTYTYIHTHKYIYTVFSYLCLRHYLIIFVFVSGKLDGIITSTFTRRNM